MATNQMRREAAKRKLTHQQERRVQQSRRRRQIAAVTSVTVVVLVLVAVVLLSIAGGRDDEAAPPAAAAPTPGACQFAPTPGSPAAKPVAVPDITVAPTEGRATVTLRTNRGEIPLTLERPQAPCTVESFVRLAGAQYFDGTPCHRLTTGAGLQVLQCGDPTGKGSGGPGYTVNDEKPTTLKPAAEPGAVTYPRGLLAMANSGRPNSGGSQFFLVYGDSVLPPDYTVFGTIGEPGLAVLDRIAGGGLTNERGPGDGAPAQPVTIDAAAVGTR